jgi:hypothetical protein
MFRLASPFAPSGLVFTTADPCRFPRVRGFYFYRFDTFAQTSLPMQPQWNRERVAGWTMIQKPVKGGRLGAKAHRLSLTAVPFSFTLLPSIDGLPAKRRCQKFSLMRIAGCASRSRASCEKYPAPNGVNAEHRKIVFRDTGNAHKLGGSAHDAGQPESKSLREPSAH